MSAPLPHVTILMATHNGDPFIAEQLASFEMQEHRNWSLVVSDDASSDGTLDRVIAFGKSQASRDIQIRSGPCRGSTANFLSLISSVADSERVVALSDQDDIWLPHHLSRALEALSPLADRPALYGARTTLCDRNGRPMGTSPLFSRPPSFRNALVQSIAGGNTMVLNAAAVRLVTEASARITTLPVCHDWWIYQLVAGAGGQVVYDPRPAILYRQHGANQIGANSGAMARLWRIGAVASGRFADWNSRNLKALSATEPLLTDEARDCLNGFRRLRTTCGLSAVSALHRLGLYRQTPAGDLSLALAAVAGRL